MKCPSCGADVAFGDTICLECGTELVLAGALPATAPSPPPPPPAGSAPVPVERVCPDCAERVSPDSNNACPVCGHDFAARIEIDEEEFFRDPPSLDEALAAARRKLGTLSREASMSDLGRHAAPHSAAPPSEPGPEPALPGDRGRLRFRGGQTGGHAPVVHPSAPTLHVEGGQTVFFDGHMTSTVRLDVDQVLIGRRDPPAGHYPDIDLGHLRDLDRHISRHHARLFRRGARWFVEDLCANDATFLDDRANPLNHETAPLEDGSRVLISDAVVLRFVAGRG
ncbi:MAG: zinc ribbon domain-containing protein [Myxococcales bacterium]|nr:zinc ribbon domain-containing protein [Myxococcales bacterium]